jgi:diguanylate cyclase (GGDEF)-like protein
VGIQNLTSEKATKGILHDLRTTGETLRAARSKKDVLEFTIRTFLRLGFDRVRIWIIDKENQLYCGAKCSYISDKKFQKIQIDLKKDIQSFPKNYFFFLEKRKPYLDKKFPILKKFFKDNKPQYTIKFPLISGKDLLGVISVDNSISNKEINLKNSENTIMPFVNHIALVLNRVITDKKLKDANIHLKKKIRDATTELKIKNQILEKLANFDDLSGLPNRRYFENYLSAQFKKANQRHPLTLAMLDIDFLKQLNDTKGHQAGDRLIKKVGKTLKKYNSIDFAARFAGDEFMLLIKDKSCQKNKKIFESILQKIKKETKQNMSIGAATYPSTNVKTEIDLIRLTDDALYHAKHTGRNRYVYATDKGESIAPLSERRLDLQEIEKSGTFAIDYIRQLRAINLISEHLRLGCNEKSILAKIAKSLKENLDFKRVCVFLKNEKSGHLKFIACSNKNDTELAKKAQTPELISKLSHQLTKAIKNRTVLDIKGKNIFREFVNNFEIKRALIIPLVGRKNYLGAIIAHCESDRIFRKNDFDFLLTLGDQIENGIVKYRAVDQIANFNCQLKKEVAIATKKLCEYSRSLEKQIKNNQNLRKKEQHIHFELISALATSLEEKDIYTQGHSVRVASYAVRIGREIGMNEKQLLNLRYAGLLHDFGKVAIDQSILKKSTALTPKETMELEKHPRIGEKIISAVRFLKSAAYIVRQHHERWDGTGYPNRLKGKQILIESRIIAIADSYDAMVTHRSYGHKMSKIKAIQEFEISSGKQFDPRLTKIFVRLLIQNKIRKSNYKFINLPN